MESLGLHLSSAISDPYFDLQNHQSSYSYQTPSSNPWSSRHDNTRGFQSQNGGFETQMRFHSPGQKDLFTSETTQDKSASNDEINPDWSIDSVKQNGKIDEDSPRQSQVALTLTWLSENYERADGVCLPRCVLYQHYLDFCKKMKFTPAGAATFGKIIRQKFPKLTTRRLGTRGQSKYHYYGIGIKETSIYYHSVYTGKGLTRFSGIKLKTEGSSRKYSLSSKTGTLLPEFPNADNLILPDGIDLEKMSTFIMMYRTHSQRILDTIISGNFEEVQNFLVHFWQGMPDHLIDLLKCDILSDIIALCDSILYKVLVDVLIPSTIQELPSNLCSDMEMFLKRLPFWLETSMELVPKHIQLRKQEVAKSFIQSLRRQSSFVNLAQTARPVLSNQEQLNKMVRDIENIDFADICSQAGFMEPSANPKLCAKMQNFYSEFKDLLSKQTQIESYTEWIDEVIDRCVIKPSDCDYELFKDKAADFLLQWEAFGALLMRELTLKNASSFVSIHLVHLMLDEYAFLVIETQQEQEVEKLLQRGVQQHMKNAEEISTKAVVRNATNKSINSPKCKKRKLLEDDGNDTVASSTEHRTTLTDIRSQHDGPVINGTAFSRPHPSNKDTISSGNLAHPGEPTRHHQNTLAIPAIKSYPPYSATYERPTYIPQFGIGSYSDYVGPSPSFGSGRIPNYTESYSQTFPCNPFSSNISPVGGNYWSDTRSHHSFSDPYQSYGYNKLSATYDTLNKSTFLRNNAYHQDNLGRPPFDSGRSFYRGTHDNIQVGSTLQVGTYGNNFMDIAPPGGQYCYQDDLFAPTVGSTFGKQYLPGPFR